ncbi:FAD-binding oxidoreductase [Thiomicrorhabdus indica]|uniref:FAD-binding oxidoreductase n=1 Tax=Thiomicrorhabdus indica TaxID=2267253 RepID=UPI00102DC4AB|nr:FAD-binding oxidoreductase [Thiomicrorhabdus indica]
MSDAIHPLKVVQSNHLTQQIIQLLLQPEKPIKYQAGDYIMLGFDTTELKPFSIAAAPREDGLLECHIRNQLDSDWMQKLFTIQAGDHLVMQGPKPQMQLQTSSAPVIFVAGGTGFAPMKALLDELLRQEAPQPIEFYWGARSPEELYANQTMLDLSSKYENLNYIPVISDDTHDWNGNTGFVHQQVLKDHPSLTGFMVYLCGPWDMTQTAKQDFLGADLPENHFIA